MPYKIIFIFLCSSKINYVESCTHKHTNMYVYICIHVDTSVHFVSVLKYLHVYESADVYCYMQTYIVIFCYILLYVVIYCYILILLYIVINCNLLLQIVRYFLLYMQIYIVTYCYILLSIVKYCYMLFYIVTHDIRTRAVKGTRAREHVHKQISTFSPEPDCRLEFLAIPPPTPPHPASTSFSSLSLSLSSCFCASLS